MAVIKSLSEVTPGRSSHFSLPSPRSTKNSYVSESSSDASNDSSNKLSLAEDDNISLQMEHVTGGKDSKTAARLRVLVIILFITLIVVVPTALYLTTRKTEVNGFENAYRRLASKVVDSVEFHLASKLTSLDSFRIAITSHAISSNATWPYVTNPNYDLRANSAREIGAMLSVSFHALVTENNRDAWENYTMENIDWLWQAQSNSRHRLLAPSRRELNEEKDSTTSPDKKEEESSHQQVITDISKAGFSKEIHMLHPSQGAMVDTSDGPYMPIWQTMPPIPETINYNALSYSSSSEAARLVLSSRGDAVMSRIENLQDVYGPETAKLVSGYYSNLLQDYLFDPAAEYEGDPIAIMYLPIFEQFNNESSVVGMLSASMSFKFFFTNLLGAEPNGVMCIIENGCGDVVSYEINGEEAIFLGRNDMHDPSFDYLEQTYDFSSVSESKVHSYREKYVRLNDEYCPYKLRVYPVNTLQDEYMTSRPVVFAVTMALAILFMAIAAFSYDYFVQRRMKKVLKTAKESRAIVHSLFPANVRERLLKEEEERSQQRSSDQRSADGSSIPGTRIFPRRLSVDTRSAASTTNTRRNSNETGITDMLQQPIHTAANSVVGAVSSMAALPAKLRLKFFLNESHHGQEQAYRLEHKSAQEEEEKPIADLFPNCTVLFADIAGFTAWSSEREPEQVFTLLQTIFKSFDRICRKRDIFKVETIGDCYVAVTGLPDPQPDHAIRMTKFARTCIQRVSEITARLESKLGPGTGSLRMRFGLHSGPVTAGVLRGEKSRFQLFGDTVNTAARMESTGMKNRIQLSSSTAQLLIEAGKENWIQSRDELVQAKGKGQIQTYWALTSRGRRTSSREIFQVEDRPKVVRSTLSTEDSYSNDIDEEDDKSGYSGDTSYWRNEDFGASKSILDFSQAAIQNDRLIDWLVDIMTKQLKQIIVGRAVERNERFEPSQALVQPTNVPRDEVTESIELPKFDPRAAKLRASKIASDVPEKVVRELRQFVSKIAAGYRDNPFHCFAHASHVTQSANKLLSRIVQPEDVNYHRTSVKAIASDLHDYTYGITSDPLTQFAVLLCCVVHDVDHTGVSNAQRGKECPSLASKYKDLSVAEQNSVDIAWNLLMEPKFKNLQQCIFATESELKRFRQLLVNMVMATDIFDREMKETRNMRWDRVFHSDMAKSVDDGELRSLKAMIVIEHIIQAADVSHTMQHWHVYKKWNQRLFDEMYLAYVNGRSPKDPSEGWYNGELWFFDNYVIPLARKLDECRVFGVASDECLNYALENRKEWAVKGKQVVKEMVAKCKQSVLNSSAVLAGQEDEIVFEVSTPVPTDKQSVSTENVSPGAENRSESQKSSTADEMTSIDSILKFSLDLDADPESGSSSTDTSSQPADSLLHMSELNTDDCDEIDDDVEISC